MSRTLALVGLGLIGGSLAASLKARNTPWRVRAADRRRSSLDYALDRGYIDEAAASPSAAAEGADLVVLATPVQAIRATLHEVGPGLRPGQVVTDVGSTKAGILREAREVLPPGVSFVGGHPVAGTERSGIESAVAGLFEGRICVLTPVDDSDPRAVEAVTDLWHDLGAQVVCMAPETHDRIFALVSHLPHALAYGLVDTVAGELEPEHATLAGGSLRDFARVTAGSPVVWREIFLENRDALLYALDAFAGRLRVLRDAVEGSDAGALDRLLRRAAETGDPSWRR